MSQYFPPCFRRVYYCNFFTGYENSHCRPNGSVAWPGQPEGYGRPLLFHSCLVLIASGCCALLSLTSLALAYGEVSIGVSAAPSTVERLDTCRFWWWIAVSVLCEKLRYVRQVCASLNVNCVFNKRCVCVGGWVERHVRCWSC